MTQYMQEAGAMKQADEQREAMTIDQNHDIVPTLRMFDGLMMNKAADEIERLRLALVALSRPDTTPVAYEFLHANGHAIVDYSEHTHVGLLSADKGYAKLPLVYKRGDVRLLTLSEMAECVKAGEGRTLADDFLDVQRKFCEVNGLLAGMPSPEEVSKGGA